MGFAKRVRDGMVHPRVRIYLKAMAVLMLLSALAHLASILSIGGTPWAARPLQVRIGDMVLLPVDLALAWGLWRTRFWAVVGWVAAVLLLQLIPFLFFTGYFATNAQERIMLYGQLVTHAVFLGVFGALLLRRKAS